MRRLTWVLALVMCVSFALAGCGGGVKEVGDVVTDLEKQVADMKGYEGKGTMLFTTGEEQQEYGLEIAYLNPHYYRIELTNPAKDITQIVLKNDDGVFVLTPSLKKSFRFQSSWPQDQGQVYLYQTLVASILDDAERKFAVDDKEKAYVFDVAANYANNSLDRQKIWLSQSDYAPKLVQVTDVNANVVVQVTFDTFAFGGDFDADFFDMQRNMTAATVTDSLPAMAEGDGDGAEEPAAEEEPQSFGIIDPLYMPEGVNKRDVQEVSVGEQKGMMLRYSGTYQYSLLETRPMEQTVESTIGEPVDLGFTVAALYGEELKTLAWTLDGVEYRLTSTDLPKEEMVKIAQSVQGQIGK